MGPIQRYLGPLVPAGDADLAGPGARPSTTTSSATPTSPRSRRRSSPRACPVSQLVSTAWASASTFRGSDKRGGANGARIRLEPQSGLGGQRARRARARCCARSRASRQSFNAAGGAKISLADLIVLGGCAAVEQAAKDAGVDVKVPFTPGPHATRSQEQTDVESFAALEPTADGFRNYLGKGSTAAGRVPADRPREPAEPERAGDDRPGRRPAGAGRELRAARALGVLTATPGTLTNDFFVNLLDMGTTWKPTSDDAETFEGRDRATGERQVDRQPRRPRLRLELRAAGGRRGLRQRRRARRSSSRDFVAAWVKVMNLDRFDLV